MPQTIDNMSVTWTNSLTTYTGIKLNAAGSSDANSAAGSLLMDLQVGGVSKFSVRKDGAFCVRNPAGNGVFVTYTNGNRWSFNDAIGLNAGNGVVEARGIQLGTATLGAEDLFLTRRAAANLRLGAADTTGTTAPTPQTLSVQSWTSSTNNNQPGANFTIAGSQGTGTGAGGSIIFQVAPAGAVSNGVQNALATALEIDSTRFIRLSGTNAGFRLDTADGSNGVGVYGTNALIGIFTTVSGLRMGANYPISWSAAASPAAALPDVFLHRDGPNTLALRNGGTSGSPVPQTFRVYNWTDGTNFERVNFEWSGNVFYLGTAAGGTGTRRKFSIAGDTVDFITGAGSGGVRWAINASGHFLANDDNTYDIGATSSGRPRHVYAGTTLRVSGVTLSPLGGVNRLAYGSSNSTSDIYAFFNPDDTLPNLRLRSTWGFGWSSSASNPVDNPFDTVLTRVGAGIVGVRASSSTTGAALSFVEQTAPAAPATDGVYIYAEDNGSGKTRLMARFATGAAVQIAIEP